MQFCNSRDLTHVKPGEFHYQFNTALRKKITIVKNSIHRDNLFSNFNVKKFQKELHVIGTSEDQVSYSDKNKKIFTTVFQILLSEISGSKFLSNIIEANSSSF